ncbi:hypothetical protein DPX16_21816 [Anabarilius grahami]|uniref:Uncharacterized protein n=1 Tax=Anabarilius grahami TaxID=495550 RepID=A0A3N0YP12_ANAGA|nr:hypothetical protein DPX16_21816 [Anabarilius grahami]
MMKLKGSFLITIGCLPLAAISPVDCLTFPQECPMGQRCLASTAVGVKVEDRIHHAGMDGLLRNCATGCRVDDVFTMDDLVDSISADTSGLRCGRFTFPVCVISCSRVFVPVCCWTDYLAFDPCLFVDYDLDYPNKYLHLDLSLVSVYAPVTENSSMQGSSSVGFRILPPATIRERLEQLRAVRSLRQEGWEVGSFAKVFWTMAVGLGYNDAALKDFFNLCLDDPLPQCEMEGILDFWKFAAYLRHRRERTSPSQPGSVHAPAQESVSEGTGEVGTEPRLHPGKGRRRRRKKSHDNTDLPYYSPENLTADPDLSSVVCLLFLSSSPGSSAQSSLPSPHLHTKTVLLPAKSTSTFFCDFSPYLFALPLNSTCLPKSRQKTRLQKRKHELGACRTDRGGGTE